MSEQPIEETEKCRAIARAALELIAEQGFHGTPISQIAKRAGVGVGSIYRYFADKDELIHAIHARLDEKLHHFIIEHIDPQLSQRERFIQLVKVLTRYLIENPLEFRFLEQYYNSPYGIEKMREKFLEEGEAVCPCGSDHGNPFKDLLASRGETIKDLPATVIHSLAFGPLIALARDVQNGLLELDDRLQQQFAECCWDAIKI
ncbi:MAG: TetR/AcrR family transcriptional regulator [Deltaproteobacteria bacterium]|nr:MAG: TetR/AcrR family transcriptional regulator [Deltaproteobacteria bacterium]